MLITLPNLLTPDQLRTCHQWLESAHWQAGELTAGALARQVKNNEQLPADAPASQAIAAMVLAALEASPVFLSAALPRRVVPPRINRHSGTTNAYGAHVDQGVRMLGNGLRVRTDLACTVFLSHPDDYDGGDLSINDTFGEHDIKLPAGHAVLYPASSVHQVRPVTRGTRLACFFWIESLVRSPEQRRLLFEMDAALQALREGTESADAVVALTGTYHNLLRMWAEP